MQIPVKGIKPGTGQQGGNEQIKEPKLRHKQGSGEG
jgi:hypothetical protein